MNSSAETSKLPMWIFIATDLALIAAAAFIASESARPLSGNATLAIVACLIAGAIVCFVPLIVYFERQKNAALDDRQRELEALARTVSSSADQISIAAGSLNDIAELSQRCLRNAEHLPHKLQEKIAEFQAQLAQVTDAEKEELERELLALRTSESDRLETVSQRIAKSAEDWTKLEAALSRQLSAANDALAKLSLGTSAAIGKAQAAAEQALAQARIEAARGLGEAGGQATRGIQEARDAALAAIDARLTAAADAIAERIAARMEPGAPAGRHHSGERVPGDVAVIIPPLPAATSPSPAVPSHAATLPVHSATKPSPGHAAVSTSPEKTSPRAEGSEETRTPPPAETDDQPPRAAFRTAPAPAAPPASASASAPRRVFENRRPAPDGAAPVEPPPIPSSRIPEISPVAPDTAAPFSFPNAQQPPSPVSAGPESGPATVSRGTPVYGGARKRSGRKTEAAEEPALDLGLDAALAPGAAGHQGATAERVLSSDGATRLLVTAYIGIGNRLYIRGAGPGLSWEKGVPLQFLSIGKWRWETNDATSPVTFKLYKNDDLECAALGAQTLDPRQQQEVTASF